MNYSSFIIVNNERRALGLHSLWMKMYYAGTAFISFNSINYISILPARKVNAHRKHQAQPWRLNLTVVIEGTAISAIRRKYDAKRNR